jgi:hypothetical protein
MTESEMGTECSTYGGKIHIGFCWGNLRERAHLGEHGVDWRIILKLILKDWIGLAYGRHKWRAVVNTAMNI